MIKIIASFLGDEIVITIDDGNISTDSKDEFFNGLIESVYYEVLASYTPAYGFLGGVMANGLEKVGAKILKVEDSQEEEDAVY
jgi:hypothetical protein